MLMRRASIAIAGWEEEGRIFAKRRERYMATRRRTKALKRERKRGPIAPPKISMKG
jgi:hypothetical protein